jgi:hypothetical protein
MAPYRLFKLVLVAALLLGGHAFANPVRCSYGYQDSTCVPPIVAAPQSPPSCPPGYTQAQAPFWGGSAWMGLSCTPPPPPPPPVLPPSNPGPAAEEAACATAWETESGNENSVMAVVVPRSTVNGPLNGNGLDQYNGVVQAFAGSGFYTSGSGIMYGSIPSASTNSDLFYINYEYNAPSFFCWVAAGTSNVIATGIAVWCSPNGGTTNCGGGGVGN